LSKHQGFKRKIPFLTAKSILLNANNFMSKQSPIPYLKNDSPLILSIVVLVSFALLGVR
jgi:hypothetical protein